MPLAQVDTPALLIDLDAFERNLERMATFVRKAGVRLRPHAKTHKSPIIGAKQMALGAVGVCCQKVSEAEVMVAGGVADVLVSNEVAGAAKLERLAALARRAKIGVCVDDADNVAELEAAAAKAGARLDVLVEIDVGARRCGAVPGEPAARLAQRISSSPHLRFAGLQAYHGSAQHVREAAERAAHIARAVAHVEETLKALKRSDSRPPPSPAPAPAPTRARRRARSTTSCRPAPTSSWTPTTPATSAPTAEPSIPSSTRSSSTPRR
jgi:D-serine deaminase-like pyridoxal phosphate-dependent protein